MVAAGRGRKTGQQLGEESYKLVSTRVRILGHKGTLEVVNYVSYRIVLKYGMT